MTSPLAVIRYKRHVGFTIFQAVRYTFGKMAIIVTSTHPLKVSLMRGQVVLPNFVNK